LARWKLAGLTPGCVIKRLQRKELQSTARQKARLQNSRFEFPSNRLKWIGMIATMSRC
jgi:hypothetical protein